MQSIPKVNSYPIEYKHSRKNHYWQSGELITIGTFAALIKISTMVIAIAGGGMNPVSMVMKNIVATSLLVVLVYKVRKFGVLSLFSLISGLVSLLLMGDNAMLLLGTLLAGGISDCFIFLVSRYQKVWSLILGVGLFDFISRTISLGYSWLVFQEELGLFLFAAIAAFIVGFINIRQNRALCGTILMP